MINASIIYCNIKTGINNISTVGSILIILLLLTERSGSFTMISSKAVNDGKVVPQSTLVFKGRKSWSDFTLLWTESLEVIDGEEQMVRCHLARHRKSHQLGSLDHFNLPHNSTH